MKLAVLADIHGNYQALQTVLADIERWQPDTVVVAGDIVNRGPRSIECLSLIQDKVNTDGWLLVRGNHEDYVLSFLETPLDYDSIRFEVYRCSHWTYEQFGGDVAALATLPDAVTVTPAHGLEAKIVHASARGNRDGIFPRTTDAELRQKIQLPDQPSPPLLCVGHTHVPLIRFVDDTQVVNVGAVGLPFDGDHRASYGRITWQQQGWSAEIIRLAYDRARAEQDFYTSGFINGGGPLARVILNELQTAHSHLYHWIITYEAPVLSGELTMQQAVDRYLAACE
jgi:predicted phosphodiesterase